MSARGLQDMGGRFTKVVLFSIAQKMPHRRRGEQWGPSARAERVVMSREREKNKSKVDEVTEINK